MVMTSQRTLILTAFRQITFWSVMDTGDHVGDRIPIAKRTNALDLSVILKSLPGCRHRGITHVHPMNFGSYDFDFGTLTYMQAQHSSCRPMERTAVIRGGFILKSDPEIFTTAATSSLMLDMQLVPLLCKSRCGNFARCGNFTMNVRDAIKASDLLECNNIVGVHFDTFGYIKIDHEKSLKCFEDSGKNCCFHCGSNIYSLRIINQLLRETEDYYKHWKNRFLHIFKTYSVRQPFYFTFVV